MARHGICELARREPFTGTVQLRYIGSGKFNATYKGPEDPGYDPRAANSISDNRVASATYVNLAASYKLPEIGSGMSVESLRRDQQCVRSRSAGGAGRQWVSDQSGVLRHLWHDVESGVRVAF